ncbi:MAG TPA: indoleacetamide hydrolase [Steroidobacteraceae bacterium]|nr:indoleacetamide hydrolase [Steroidobacteraceae bacterium]
MSDAPGSTRRDFILGMTAMAAAAQASGKTSGDDLTGLSAAEAVTRMKNGDITAEAYAQALLRRCDAVRSLNAFITLEPQRVLEAARECDRRRQAGRTLGPLHGLPIPVKDSVNTADLPTTVGTPALRRFHPAEDAPVVRRLIDAGALVQGKTNLHELSYGWTSNNLAFGAVHNPYDPTRIPGGSSGGTAAAVAAAMAPLGIAEDTEGSIRVPAALCGIVGFRPTTGRYPTEGAAPISSLFDQVGPHARQVSDVLLFDSVVTGDRRALRARELTGVRFGIPRGYCYSDLHPEVARISEDVLRRLQAAGAQLVEADVTDIGRLVGLTTLAIQNHDVRPGLTAYLQRYHAGISFEQLVAQASPDIRGYFGQAVLPGSPDFISEEVYRKAVEIHLPELRASYARYFAAHSVDALLFPTTSIPAPRIGDDGKQDIGGKSVSFEQAIARNISPGSTAGLPGLVLPAGLTSGGLPVSIELDGPAGSDRALLAIGAAVERVLGPLPRPKI